jgi:hypothetical protein
MALYLPAAQLCASVARSLSAAGFEKPYRVLSFSYQDVILSDTELDNLIGAELAALLPRRDDSPEIVRWHKCQEFCKKIVEAHAFYKALGFDNVTDVDLSRFRGTEVIGDLNHTLPPKIKKRNFHLVIDNVVQHCLNLGNALQEIESRVAIGGYVMHIVPLTAINQGYFNLCPNALHDFYTARGYTVVEHLGYFFDRKEGTKRIEVSTDLRQVWPGDNYWQVFCARKDAEMPGVGWPLQGKFQRHPESEETAVRHYCWPVA